jgi:drug/metabolite transporter (DMT)-like permease
LSWIVIRLKSQARPASELSPEKFPAMHDGKIRIRPVEGLIQMWMIFASLMFAIVGLSVKKGAETFNTAELIFWRGLISLVVLGAMAHFQGVSLRTAHPKLHASRSLIGAFSMTAWFYSLSFLPLASAMTLNYLSSVWVALFLVGVGFAAYVASPRQVGQGASLFAQLALLATVVAGFSGVVMILKPSTDIQYLGGTFAGLLSGLLAAFAYLQVVQLSRLGEPNLRVVFYFALATMLVGALWMTFTGISTWQWKSFPWLLLTGISAAVAQLALTRAYGNAKSHVETLVVANLQYSGILFALSFGIVFFDETIDRMACFGIAVVILSGISATVIRDRLFPKAPAEDH